MIRKCLLMLFSLLISTAVLADVYKWVDGTGETHYTDRADTIPAGVAFELVPVESRRTNTARVNAQRQETIALERQRQLRAGDEAEQAVEQRDDQREVRAERETNCQKAREQYDNMYNYRRLYRPTEDGGREYLSSEETDQVRAKAQAAVDEWC